MDDKNIPGVNQDAGPGADPGVNTGTDMGGNPGAGQGINPGRGRVFSGGGKRRQIKAKAKRSSKIPAGVEPPLAAPLGTPVPVSEISEMPPVSEISEMPPVSEINKMPPVIEPPAAVFAQHDAGAAQYVTVPNAETTPSIEPVIETAEPQDAGQPVEESIEQVPDGTGANDVNGDDGIDIEHDTKMILNDLGRIINSVETRDAVTIYPQQETAERITEPVVKAREPAADVPVIRQEPGRRTAIRTSDMLITGQSTPFQYQEAFHSLRTNIKYLAAERECRKIVVTSSIPGEGKSIVSINLALALSASNNTVVLIDADLRKPMLHNYLGIEDGLSMGLTNIMSGDYFIKDCMYSFIDKPNLFVVPCGMIPLNPTEILGSRRMGNFINEMAEGYDYIILDTPPVSVVTDAAAVSGFADGVLLVVRQKLVTFEQAKRAKQNLENVGANIIGTVLNDFNIKHLENAGAYNYYNYYYSYDGYGY